jgi:hypothetical protein
MSLCAEVSLEVQDSIDELDDSSQGSSNWESEEEAPAAAAVQSSDKAVTPQQLRALIRQCQQAQKELSEVLVKAGVHAEPGSGEDTSLTEQLPVRAGPGPVPEEEAAARVQVDKARRRNRKLMRQLNAALRPLALRMMEAGS